MVKIQVNKKAGGTVSVTIPKAIARAMRLNKGDEVDWVWSDYEQKWMVIKR